MFQFNVDRVYARSLAHRSSADESRHQEIDASESGSIRGCN